MSSLLITAVDRSPIDLHAVSRAFLVLTEVKTEESSDYPLWIEWTKNGDPTLLLGSRDGRSIRLDRDGSASRDAILIVRQSVNTDLIVFDQSYSRILTVRQDTTREDVDSVLGQLD